MSAPKFVFPFPKGAPGVVGQSHWSQDQGVDIAAPGHTPLLAVGDGTIVGHGISGFGDYAPILHLPSGHFVYYGHAGPGRQVPVGTKVKAGQIIGEVGAGISGISSGPHLEIGFSDAHGAPVGGTSGQVLSLLKGAGSATPSQGPLGGLFDTHGGPLDHPLDTHGGPLDPSHDAQVLVSAIFDSVAPDGARILLYGVLLMGGTADGVDRCCPHAGRRGHDTGQGRSQGGRPLDLLRMRRPRRRTPPFRGPS